jgi:hypothetical protein
MTRTTKTAAAPAPRDRSNGPVRTVKVEPSALADLSSADLAALLSQAASAQPTKARAAAAPRVTLTEQAAAAFDAMGWKAPKVTAHSVTEPQRRQSFNACKGAAAYTVAVAVLQNGPLPLVDLARLWLASNNEPKTIGAIAQQIANRAGRPVIQTADALTLG